MRHELQKIICACPCGKGQITYSITAETDDTDPSRYKIKCSACQKQYTLTRINQTIGLIDKDYPAFKHDEDLYRKIQTLEEQLSVIDSGVISKEDEERRIRSFLYKDELKQYRLSPSRLNLQEIQNEIQQSEKLIRHFTKEELQNAYQDLQTQKYSTKLSPETKRIVKFHCKITGTRQVDNVAATVRRAIYNYEDCLYFTSEFTSRREKTASELTKLKRRYHAEHMRYKTQMKKNMVLRIPQKDK